MTAIRCTAPRQGHRPGSAAERACPEHGRQARPRDLPVAVVAPVSSDEPTVVERYSDGSIKSEEWLVDGKRHRIDGPAVVQYRSDGTVEYETWVADGKTHRTDGPARVWYHTDGTVEYEEWLADDQFHRTDGPAAVRYHSDGTVETEEWLVGDKTHRTDGPAYVRYHPDGTVEYEEWHLDGTRVEPWQVLGRHLLRQGVPKLSTEALRQIAKDVPWQRWDELVSDHPLVRLWGTVHPSTDARAD